MIRPFDEALLVKVDRILRILAVLATKDMKQREQISVLNRAGLPPKEIADLIGTTGNTVRVELVALRHANRRDQGKRGARSHHRGRAEN